MFSERLRHFLFLSANLLVAVVLYISFVNSLTQPVSANTELTPPTTYSDPDYKDTLLNGTFDLINSHRSEIGQPKLIQSRQLDKIAEMRAQDMAKNGYYAHKSPSGEYFSDIMKDQGVTYHFACENLNISDVPSADNYVTTWLASKPHKDCIQNKIIKYAGYADATITLRGGVPMSQTVIVAIYAD